MAKKKNQAKKHKFRHAEPSAPQTGVQDVETSAQSAPRRPQALAAGMPARDFSYVLVDLRRIAIFAASLVLLELVLWYLFAHTGLGNSIYHLVNV